MTKRVEILGIPIDALTMQETVDRVIKCIEDEGKLLHTCINAGKVVLMQGDSILTESTINADLISADGQAIVWAGSILGRKLPERVAGIDLMEVMVSKANDKGYKIFFLGAKEEVVTKLVADYTNAYGEDIIAGFRNGYFSAEEEDSVVEEINQSGANILFVAMSSPKKEVFLYENRSKLEANFLMGVGGSFDVISGKISRAPQWMQNNGLEWFFRFIKEPRKMWKRYLVGNTRFIVMVVKEWAKSFFSR